jgi:multidrug efflux pump
LPPHWRRLGEIADRADHVHQLARQHQHSAAIRDRPHIGRAARDVQAAINARWRTCRATCRLPRGSEKPTSAAPVFALALASKTISTSAMYDVADTVIAQRILAGAGRG